MVNGCRAGPDWRRPFALGFHPGTPGNIGFAPGFSPQLCCAARTPPLAIHTRRSAIQSLCQTLALQPCSNFGRRHHRVSCPLLSCSRVWEFNDEGSIPYVPYLRAPYYVWIGRVPKLETLLVENKVPSRLPSPTLRSLSMNSTCLSRLSCLPCLSRASVLWTAGFTIHEPDRDSEPAPEALPPAAGPDPGPTAARSTQVEAPAFFPPSFLYTQSWEDPRADEPHLQVGQPGCKALALGWHSIPSAWLATDRHAVHREGIRDSDATRDLWFVRDKIQPRRAEVASLLLP